MENEIVSIGDIDNIYKDISGLIQQKNNVKNVVNDAMISFYWELGKDFLKN